MRYTLLSHYQLVAIAKRNKKSLPKTLEIISERIRDGERKNEQNKAIELAKHFRMLERLSEGNALRREFQKYQI